MICLLATYVMLPANEIVAPLFTLTELTVPPSAPSAATSSVPCNTFSTPAKVFALPPASFKVPSPFTFQLWGPLMTPFKVSVLPASASNSNVDILPSSATLLFSTVAGCELRKTTGELGFKTIVPELAARLLSKVMVPARLVRLPVKVFADCKTSSPEPVLVKPDGPLTVEAITALLAVTAMPPPPARFPPVSVAVPD